MSDTTFDVDVIAAGEKKVLRFANGQVVFGPGDPVDCAYIVKSGRVQMREKDRALEAIGQGEIFGELALIDRKPRTSSAVAAGPVELIPIDRAMFDVLIRDDPDFAMTIIRLLARSLRTTMDLLRAEAEYPAERLRLARRA
jgi:CRP/FNR family cyclic AMP-dependent transcriptional regulator